MYLVAKREIKRLLQKKILFVFILVAPTLSFLLIEYLFSGGAVREIPAVVVDLDQSDLSREIIKTVEASPMVNIVGYCADAKQAKHKMYKGDVYAVIIFPENLEKDVTSVSKAEVNIFCNNSNLVLGGNVFSGIYTAISSVNNNIKVKRYIKEGMPMQKATVKAKPLDLDVHRLFNPYINYAYFLVTGLLPVMLIVFTFLINIYALGSELKESTAGELMKTANNSVLNAILGKYIPYTVIFFVDAMIMNLILFKILQVPIEGNIWIMLAAEFLVIIAYQSVAVVFLAITGNMRLSLSLGSAYSLLSFSFSGLTYPMIAMPLVAKILSWIFPFTFWLPIFMGETLKAQPLLDFKWHFIIIFIFIFIGMLAFPVMKKNLTDPSKWGRR